MVGIGEKIKDAVTGHHDTTATNKNDSLDCEDRGAQHHTGHAHHDPEADAKKATSAAGNYPYWGNIDREGQGHRSEGLGSGSRETQQQQGHSNISSIGSGAGAGVAGAGYLASRDRDDNMGHQARSSVPGTHTGGTTATSSGRHHDPERDAQHATSAAGNYPNNTNDHDSRREKEYLGAGAGAAGLAGAGYLASRDRNDGHQSSNAPGPNQRNVAFSGNNAAPGTTQTGSGLHSSGQQHRHDPELDAQKATSAAGNYPHLGEQGEHNRNRDERNLGAGAAGLTGAAGAGYLGHQKLGERNDAQQSYPSREANTGHSVVPSSFDQLESNSRRSADPYGAGTSSSTGGHHDGHNNRRGEEGLVGAAGLGAAGYAANEKHRQHNDTTRGETGFNNEGYNSNDTTPAQVAAQKAWAQENSATSGSFQEPGANYSRSDNNNMRSDNNNNLRSDAEYVAAGTAAGAGATGLAHRQHGHGQTGTEDPSRTHAHRGSDTTDYAAQNSQSGARRSSRAGSTGESGDQPRVVHKCTKCGHDNVISHYAPLFRKDATARTVQ